MSGCVVDELDFFLALLIVYLCGALMLPWKKQGKIDHKLCCAFLALKYNMRLLDIKFVIPLPIFQEKLEKSTLFRYLTPVL